MKIKLAKRKFIQTPDLGATKGIVMLMKNQMLCFFSLLFILIFGCIEKSTGQDNIGSETNITETDVCIYGGTPSGIIAAVAASRNGVQVLLIEQTKHVGGLSTSGLNTAETEHMINNAITGYAR